MSINVLAVALQSMHDDSSRMERISMNLANTVTPGYKRDVAVIRPFADYVQTDYSTSIANETNSVPDMRPGTLKATGVSLDLALEGKGFFEVQTDQGVAYTRQGNFHIDARGRLVTAQGYPVMGKEGEVVLGSGVVTIETDGRVTQKDTQTSLDSMRTVAQLKVVEFDRSKSLQRIGDGLVLSAAGTTVMADADVQVRQGFLENSNVSSMHEMMQMMQTVRHFESMQKVTQGYDEMMATAIRKLGDV